MAKFKVKMKDLRAEVKESKLRARAACLSHYWCVLPCEHCDMPSRRLFRPAACLRCHPELDPRPPALRES